MTDDLNDLFEAQAEWVAPEATPSHGENDLPAQTTRRERRRQHEHKRRRFIVLCISVLVVGALVVVGGLAAARTIKRLHANQATTVVDDYPGPGNTEVEFTVHAGESVSSVASRLVKASVVKSSTAFINAIAANSSTIYPGTYVLKHHMSSSQVVRILSDATKASGFLEVKSGQRVSDVIVHAAQLSGIDKAQFDQIVDSGGQGILPAEASGHFEGWLEPGAYEVKGKGSAARIMKSMVDKRIAKLDGLKVPTGPERQQILAIASIAESEVNSTQYYGKVVRVIHNRLDAGMPLGMDTTVAYGAHVQANELTDAMLADASNPYNTRIHNGLPPSPISSPGDNAIEAALNPPAGPWMYFVTTNLKTGETKFAVTADEFARIREEYKDSNENAN
ncbi:UPF0755 protein [Bifidobacterium bohemicum]|uniref:endolytic transglycosylase MltG n=1 Tax=Bifidobacterium bohemicum TaxID=638617 RepID=UPI00052A0EEC|nr:endolytic transglycosylase MltG [Bifidobacterium bohemicum]SCB81139.1 UPF0755 protein [Bifidobacterium bohemicum]